MKTQAQSQAGRILLQAAALAALPIALVSCSGLGDKVEQNLESSGINCLSVVRGGCLHS